MIEQAFSESVARFGREWHEAMYLAVLRFERVWWQVDLRRKIEKAARALEEQPPVYRHVVIYEPPKKI